MPLKSRKNTTCCPDSNIVTAVSLGAKIVIKFVYSTYCIQYLLMNKKKRKKEIINDLVPLFL